LMRRVKVMAAQSAVTRTSVARSCSLAGVALTLAGALAFAQAPGSNIEFEAASVKLSEGRGAGPGGMRGGPGTDSPGRINYSQVVLLQLLMKAWNVRESQIVGPQWLKEFDRSRIYTVIATMPTGTTEEQFEMMLQDLIRKRFRVAGHREMQNVPGYDLVVAKGGSKLREAELAGGGESLPSGIGKDGFGVLPPGHGASVVSGVTAVRAKFQQYTMSEFVNGYLRLFMNGDPGPIEDRTALSGRYDFTLQFAREAGASQTVSGVRNGPAGAPQKDSAAELLPGLLTALQDQLGLKLVRVKEVPLNMLVIDHIEKIPTDN
jgi:uncharacterized protein (TIGR03435 family)